MGKEMCNLSVNGRFKEEVVIARTSNSGSYGYMISSDYSVKKADNITGVYLKLTWTSGMSYSLIALKSGEYLYLNAYTRTVNIVNCSVGDYIYSNLDSVNTSVVIAL